VNILGKIVVIQELVLLKNVQVCNQTYNIKKIRRGEESTVTHKICF
jgi:hypothetical protein